MLHRLFSYLRRGRKNPTLRYHWGLKSKSCQLQQSSRPDELICQSTSRNVLEISCDRGATQLFSKSFTKSLYLRPLLGNGWEITLFPDILYCNPIHQEILLQTCFLSNRKSRKPLPGPSKSYLRTMSLRSHTLVITAIWSLNVFKTFESCQQQNSCKLFGRIRW